MLVLIRHVLDTAQRSEPMPHDGAGVNCVKWYVGVAAMMKSAKLGRWRRDEESIQADKLKNSDSLMLGDVTLFCMVVGDANPCSKLPLAL
jgi:hypothetical protein